MTGASSLNPYAAAYVPLSKRVAVGSGSCNGYKGFNNGNEKVWYGNQLDYTSMNGHQHNVSCNAEFTQWNHRAGEVYLPSQYTNEAPEKLNFDQEFMDLVYLEMNFPGISEDSISDVYLANKCDLEGAIDMLNQLEHEMQLYPDDPSNMLPNTLDIGDVPESRPSSELTSRQQWNSTTKARAPTSGQSILSSNT